VVTLSLAQLVTAWESAGPGSPHRRLSALMAVVDGPDAGRDETLGDRNRRLFQLHRALVGTPIEAHVTCADCGVDSEFVVPADDILSLAAPDPDTRVEILAGPRVLAFRQPRMADLDAVGHAPSAEHVRRAVVERCRIENGEDAGAVPDDVVEQLGIRLDALDPAANIVVTIACAGCRRPLAASVDLAAFVARDLDRVVDGVCRDIDIIASAYGWDEATILALAPARRRRYVAMIMTARPHELPRHAGRAK
jgi:hypothetical protein